MLTGELKNKVDQIWNAFWAGGIANPIEVIEQMTYLLFIRRLDEEQTREENRANSTKRPMERRIYPEGKDPKGRPYDSLRWGRFKDAAPAEMFTIVVEHVFPFLRTLGGDNSTYAQHMKDARFTIPTPALLAKVVDLLDALPMDGRDTKGDIYEYMLGKIASAGQNGQFRTPRHIKPYAGVSTAILLFTKTNSGGTDHVWFYDMQADGWSLDDKRQPLLPEEKRPEDF